MRSSIIKTLKLTITLCTLCLMTLLSVKSFAAIENYEFANDTQRERYQHLIDDMRCPKCQNQNLANSDSPISADLRREIYEQIKAGHSDKEISDYMVARYGDFILYNPQVKSNTFALWSLPLILIVVGVIVVIFILRSRRSSKDGYTTNLSASERQELNTILENHPEPAAAESVASKSVATEVAVDELPKAETRKKAAPKKTAAKPAKTKEQLALNLGDEEKPKAAKAKAKATATAEKKPAAKKSATKATEKKTVEKKPAAAKPAVKKTAEKKATEKKTAEKKTEKKAAEKKSPAKKPTKSTTK